MSTKFIQLRFSPEEHELIMRAAKLSAIPAATTIRALAIINARDVLRESEQ